MGLEQVVYLFNHLSNGNAYGAQKIALGKAVPDPTHAVGYQATGFVMKLYNAGTPPTDTGKSVTRDQVVQFVKILDEHSYSPTVYTNVFNHTWWKAYYGFGSRSVKYMGATGEALGAAENTYPCHDCKLILPERLITVDHQRPQAGHAYEAVIKVFRAMGLAQGTPKGHKGQTVVGYWAGLVGGVSGPPSGSTDDRYSTNDIGSIYLTLVAWAGETAALETACMHHMINLRPLCPSCNSPTRNVQKYA